MQSEDQARARDAAARATLAAIQAAVRHGMSELAQHILEGQRNLNEFIVQSDLKQTTAITEGNEAIKTLIENAEQTDVVSSRLRTRVSRVDTLVDVHVPGWETWIRTCRDSCALPWRRGAVGFASNCMNSSTGVCLSQSRYQVLHLAHSSSLYTSACNGPELLRLSFSDKRKANLTLLHIVARQLAMCWPDFQDQRQLFLF